MKKIREISWILLGVWVWTGQCFGAELAETEILEHFTAYEEKGEANLIEQYLEKLSEVPMEKDGNCQILRFSEAVSEQTLLQDFSIYTPSLPAEEAKADLTDLESAANWAIYDTYRCQLEGESGIGENTIVDVSVLEDFFEDEWQEVKGFGFAEGCFQKEDSRYYWIPVYYPMENGEIYGDTVYLFLYILREGADQAYLSERMYYASYGEYRGEKFLLADQELVAEFLDLLRSQSALTENSHSESEYEHLSLDDEGDAVRALQEALVEQGFMSSSVDGYYGPLTQEAVSQYQEAAGLNATGEADAATQRALLSQDKEIHLLLEWLEEHR